MPLVYMKINIEVGNIGDNLNNYEAFTLTTRDLRDHFTIFMKRYELKARREIKVSKLLKT